MLIQNPTFTGSISLNGTNIASVTSSFESSASLSTRVTNLETTSSNLTVASSSFSTRVTNIEANYATTGSNTLTGTQNITNTTVPTNFDSTAALYTAGGLRVKGNVYLSSSLYLKGDLTVYGTQSINYITSSQLDISDNIINVNTAVPGVRFGGIAVYDSGSTGLTGSFLWDSQNNKWIYSNPSGSSYDGGMVIFGPRNSSGLGSEQGTTNNALMKGQGGDHITSSVVFEDSNLNIGIGTTSPLGSSVERTLHLSDNGAGYTTLYVTNGANTLRGIFAVANAASTISIGTQTNHHLRIVTNDTVRLTVSSSGVVDVNQYMQIGQGISGTQYTILSENQLYRLGGGTLYINNSGTGNVSIAGGGGHIGIGTTPSSWASPFQVIQGGTYGQSIGFQNNNADMKIGVNNYYNGSSYIYHTTNKAASQLNIGADGGFNFNTAAVGTAGNVVSFTEKLAINNLGYVTKPYQPFFQAYNSAGSSWTTGQTIVWGTALNNVGGGYSTSTGRFTAPVAGVYLFRADFRAPADGSNILDIKTSTGLMTRHEENATYGNKYHQTLAAIYKLAAGDYVYCECGAGTQSPDSNSIDRFEGYLLG